MPILDELVSIIRPFLRRDRPPRLWPVRDGERHVAITRHSVSTRSRTLARADREAEGYLFCSEHGFLGRTGVNGDRGHFWSVSHRSGSFTHIPQGNVKTVDQVNIRQDDGAILVTSPRRIRE